jgi:sulfoacetaldehyde dehydrogenase
VVDGSIYDEFLNRLQAEGGYLVSPDEKRLLEAAYWDAEGHRTPETIARAASIVAARAGFTIPEEKSFLIVEERHIGGEYRFSTEKLGTVLAIFRYDGFDQALEMVRQIFETGGKGHSCGIYSFDDGHIDRLAQTAPVSRIMVRQVQSSSNAGTFTNGMPMTSSMGCGVWGGNITNENISLKHYMNVTWVSRPIAEDRPSEQELFGEFYDSGAF